MKILENLGFFKSDQLGQKWSYNNTFFISSPFPNDRNQLGKTKITKRLHNGYSIDKRENILYQGFYGFDKKDFCYKILKNVGIIEKIKGQKIIEHKKLDHIQTLTGLGFLEVKPDLWTKNIFLVSLIPPRFEDDRGKCIILKKPNYSRLIKNDMPANVVYKGRYFFDDDDFTKTLFRNIGFYIFECSQKNKDYEFNIDTLEVNGRFLYEEFLKF